MVEGEIAAVSKVGECSQNSLSRDKELAEKNAWQLANEALNSLKDAPLVENKKEGEKGSAGNIQHEPVIDPWRNQMPPGGQRAPYNNGWYPVYPPSFGYGYPMGYNSFEAANRFPPYNMPLYGHHRRPMYPQGPNSHHGYRQNSFPYNRFNSTAFSYDNFYNYQENGYQQPNLYTHNHQNQNFTSFETNHNKANDHKGGEVNSSGGQGSIAVEDDVKEGIQEATKKEIELEKPKSFADAVKKNKIIENKKKMFQKENPVVFRKMGAPKNSKPSWTSKGFSEIQHIEGSEQNGFGAEKPQNISDKMPQKSPSNESLSDEPKAKQSKQDSDECEKEEKKGLKEWPEAMKEWVRCSFEQCETEHQKDKLEKQIKPYINQVIKNRSAWTIDWSSKSLFEVGGKEAHTRKRNQVIRNHKNRCNSRSRSRSRSISISPPRRFKSRYRSDSDENSDVNDRVSVASYRNIRSRVGKKISKKERRKSGVHEEFKVEEDSDALKKKQDRASRFQKSVVKKGTLASPILDDTSFYRIDDLEDSKSMNYHVNGTSQELIKPYFRLTSAPDPSTVRPLHILEKSLDITKERWKATQDYHFACEQMKSIRQDLTVQGIKNEFSVKVYECHARIALEKGDREEFNQCQTCLKALYSQGIPGEIAEFTAYNILYYIYTKETSDLNSCLASLSIEMKKDEVVHHALEVRSALALSNHCSFFKLYTSAPRMAGYLMDLFIERERKESLKRMVKTYRPTLDVSYIASKLAFQEEECQSWLQKINVSFVPNDTTKIDCKAPLDI